MSDPTTDPRVLPGLGAGLGAELGSAPSGSIWMRGLAMLVFGLLIGMAQTVLQALTVGQFVPMVVGQDQPNARIASFGGSLGGWLAKAAAFQTA